MFTWISNPITGYLCQKFALWACSIGNVLRSTSDFFRREEVTRPRILSRIQKLQPHLPFRLEPALPTQTTLQASGWACLSSRISSIT